MITEKTGRGNDGRRRDTRERQEVKARGCVGVAKGVEKKMGVKEAETRNHVCRGIIYDGAWKGPIDDAKRGTEAEL